MVDPKSTWMIAPVKMYHHLMKMGHVIKLNITNCPNEQLHNQTICHHNMAMARNLVQEIWYLFQFV